MGKQQTSKTFVDNIRFLKLQNHKDFIILKLNKEVLKTDL